MHGSGGAGGAMGLVVGGHAREGAGERSNLAVRPIRQRPNVGGEKE